MKKVTALVLALIIGMLSFAACQSAPTEESYETNTFIVTLYAEEVPNFAAESVGVGDSVYDAVNDVEFGKVTDVRPTKSVSYFDNTEKIVIGDKFGYSSVTVEVELEGAGTGNGWKFGDTLYGIGHKGVFHAGDAEIEFTVRNIAVKSAVTADTTEAE